MVDVQVRRAAAPWSLWRLCRFVFTRVIWSPIASGRLKDNGWPGGLKGIVVAWVVVYVTMTAAAVFSTQIRRHSPLLYDGLNTVPVVAVPLVTVAIVFALTCLYTAALHLVWWLRLPVVVLVVACLARLGYWDDMRWNDAVVLVAAGLLVILLLLRWGRPFHWLEFVAALLIIGVGVVAVVIFTFDTDQIWAADPGLNQLQQLAASAWALAVPAGLVAGAAVAELTVSTVAWTVNGVWQSLSGWRRWSPAWGVAAVAVLGAGRAVQVGWHVWHGDDAYELASVLPTMVMFAAVMVVCALVTWRADRVHRGDPPVRPDPDDVVTHWSGWSIVLALLLSVSLNGSVLVSILLEAVQLRRAASAVRDLGGGWQYLVLALAAAVAALCVAVVLSGRGRRVAPLILAATGAWVIASAVPGRLDLLATEPGLTVGASLAALGVFCWLLVRRRLTAVRGVALATVLVLAGVFEYRDVFEEPLTAALSLVGVSAAVLVGLVWRMLTDGAYSRHDSARFPRPSRVLVLLASTCYAVTSIAVTSLVGGAWSYDFARLEFAGDHLLGPSLACAAFFAGLSLAARGRLVRSPEPRDDQGRLLPQGPS